jgi:competence protein ComEC
MARDHSAKEPLPVCFVVAAAGILTDRMLGISIAVWLSLAVLTLGVWFRFFRRNRLIPSLMTLSFLFAASGLWHHCYWNLYSPNDPGFLKIRFPVPVVMEGTVAESPRLFAAAESPSVSWQRPTDYTQFTFRAVRLRNGNVWQEANGRVLAVVSGELPNLHYGDTVRIAGKITVPTPAKNPGDYDQAESLRQARILSVVRVDSAESVTILQKGPPSAGRFLEWTRRKAHASLQNSISPKNRDFASAILLGIRENVDTELEQSMLESGTIHILAISGLHVGLIALGIHWILRRLGLKRKSLAVSLACSILFYMLLTDVRPSVVRVTILILVGCLAIYRGQPKRNLNTLAAAAILVLMLNPTNLFRIGAQLSFLATGVFVWFYGVPTDWLGSLSRRRYRAKSAEQALEIAEEEWGPPENSLTGAVTLIGWQTLRCLVNATANAFVPSLLIWLAAIPLILHSFHLLTPVAILVNPLIWLPLMLSLLSCMILVLTAPVCSPAAILFGKLADVFLTCLTGLIGFFHSLPCGFFQLPGPADWWLVMFYFPLIFWTLFPRWRPSVKRLCVFATVLCLLGAGVYGWNMWNRQQKERLTVRVLDVGHGLAIHINTPDGKNLLYDVGCLASPLKPGRTAARSVWDMGSTTVDAVFLSHPDADHYNGLSSLMEKIHVKSVYCTAYMFAKKSAGVTHLYGKLQERNIPIRILHAGDTLEDTGFPRITVLHPPPPEENSPLQGEESNAMSLVLAVEHCGRRILLTGDVEDSQLRFLQTPAAKFDLVLSPHHGSVQDSAKEIMNWSQPDNVVVSGGLFQYREETETYYRSTGCRFFRTLENGMIEIRIDKTSFTVTPFLP